LIKMLYYRVWLLLLYTISKALVYNHERTKPHQHDWDAIGVDPRIANALVSMGAKIPTQVQCRAIPKMLKGEDCVVHAPTGSGKTLAYLVPIFNQINPERQAIQAIIVVPTRELGLQVTAVARRLASGTQTQSRIIVMPLLAGSKLRRQRLWAWASPPHIIIANAIQLEQMIRLGGLKKMPDLRIFVVDEIDAFFDDESLITDRNALKASFLRLKDFTTKSNQRQHIFATATIEQPRYFVQSKLQDWCQGRQPLYISIGSKRSPPSTLSHFFTCCSEPSKRLTAARKILKKRLLLQTENTTIFSNVVTPPVLIFFDESRPLHQFAQIFQRIDGHRVGILTPDSDLDQRAKALADFRSGRIDLLLATDLAARGLDLPQIKFILNFDPPKNAVSYLHRAGRAGRMGNTGSVITIIHEKERFAFERILNYCGLLDDLPPDILLSSPVNT